ncbi:oligopeptidase F. Metallo peptidase. MEROPS family M03B [Atopostipes suicloacalis DSM 15692]|uniref:Oligopeptidase F n=1 Tax=Atopostipes suicloacalis DSM 15692 TaxID=1121025 RepID=A0A1M4WL27_9LACT|nr:oligoendopeptidase F [Atopostipes suicloacalis]SHE82011.1 oligopeptidase F. Metallo peptidase. MEROPS family M03B [Atopostipes suicloacalis DSM 15692]
MAEQLKPRSEVSEDLKWDLTGIFATEEDFKAALEIFPHEVDAFVEQYKGKLKDAEIVVEALHTYEKIIAEAGYLQQYAMLPVNADITDGQAASKMRSVATIISKESAKLSFFDSEVLTLSESEIAQVAKIEPAFKAWVRKTNKNKKAALAPEVEEALELLDPVLGSYQEIFEQARSNDPDFGTFEVDGKEYPLSFVLYEDYYMYHTDPKVRRASYDQFNKVLGQYKNTVATAYYNQVVKEKTIATMRGYDSVIDYLLEPQEVTREMYNRQIDVIMEKFAPVMQKYITHLKEKNGLDKVTYADLKIDVDPEFKQDITIEETKDLVKEALAPFGQEYVDLILSSYDERWVDFARNIGKRSGAFCSTTYQKHPYIMMSFSGLLSDAYTLFHELGHAGQGVLSHQNNSNTGARPSLYLIEAPSTFHELLLTDYLKERTDDPREERSALSMMISKTYFHNFVTHLLEAAYQREVYRLIDDGESFDANKLSEIKRKVLEQFWGDAVEIEPGAELTWMRQAHYYMGLYPYTYSAGLTIATQAFLKIKSGESDMENWLDFLRLGGQEAPLEATKVANVDVDTDQALLDTIEYLDESVDRIIELSGQLEG